MGRFDQMKHLMDHYILEQILGFLTSSVFSRMVRARWFSFLKVHKE